MKIQATHSYIVQTEEGSRLIEEMNLEDLRRRVSEGAIDSDDRIVLEGILAALKKDLRAHANA